MDADSQFWLTIWKIVGVCFSVLILRISGCSMQENYIIKELVADGADPIKASCAISGMGESRQGICAVAANK